MKTRLISRLALTAILSLILTNSHAALVARYLGGASEINAYYDTESNITWLKNTLMGAGELDLFNLENVNDNGSMRVAAAWSYLTRLNTANYLGFNDWRMPNANLTDSTCQYTGFSGLSFGRYCDQNEMIRLFENNASARSLFDFHGADRSDYWTANFGSLGLYYNWTAYGYNVAARTDVAGDDGSLTSQTYGVFSNFYTSDYSNLWVVRTGDIATSSVPEPATAALLMFGLVAFGWQARRRRN
jgi:hypothetical protein